MGNFNRDRSSRDGGRSRFGGGFRSRSGFGQRRDDKQMFDVVCSNCGKNCQVPFRPTGDKPVYCSECFEKMGNRGERRSFDKKRFSARNGQGDQYKAQLEALNVKLDKILNLLQPKSDAESTLKTEVIAEIPTEEVKIKSFKSKKSDKDKTSAENE